ncbi:uncharacterized protein L969DRAFT_94222 [Mixia osmundae IAM 14324]|uniref:Protein-lysine N-methyltransferase EFM6 n=1 Tax=Mixia osmundae (strain CBS 9802 / IAM 14324 / JCM 22182 / KY 12970) TaxID=764103 RepID=G7E6F6_MIXOS|nr:uncharacterized protein L969DRAFT_94222 [Mixia osmundae IAM 14324]KEI40427.1 hypothetical protein L969DRAFT_94222 [Mixia osmundae IAM 14324]GAA98416.1 hypothetical protein E5Q_05102 [Mixia osmundae IAM 14324]
MLGGLVAGIEAGDDDEGDEDAIVPAQGPSVKRQTICFDESFPSAAPNFQLLVDAGPGCGGITWPAAEVLTAYLANILALNPSWLEGKRIVELGAGTGAVSMALARMMKKRGSRTTIYSTDQAILLDLMDANTVLNDVGDTVNVRELSWGETIASEMQTPDIILAADCVYFEPAFPLLMKTLRLLATPTSEILFCYKKRRKADKRFFVMLRKVFTVTAVVEDFVCHRDFRREAIFLYRLSLRSR